MKKDPALSPVFAAPANRMPIFLLASLLVFALAGCKSPEQVKKERLDVLEKFTVGVAKHILDRNPETVKESITHLQREELSEQVFEKLQSDGHLPKTELGELKIIEDAQEQHTTNTVDVSAVKPLGPVEKDIVPLQVSGQVTEKTEGKPDTVKPFTFNVTCKLNEETGGWPQVVEISALEPPKPKPPAAKEVKQKGKKKRRHH